MEISHYSFTEILSSQDSNSHYWILVLDLSICWIKQLDNSYHASQDKSNYFHTYYIEFFLTTQNWERNEETPEERNPDPSSPSSKQPAGM